MGRNRKGTLDKNIVYGIIDPNERPSVAFADLEVKNHRHSFTVSCTMMCTIIHLLMGIVLPLADSFVTRNKQDAFHTYYLEVFLIVQYVSATLSLLYLQLYIYIYERKMKRSCRMEDQNEFREIVDDFAVQFSELHSDSHPHYKVKFNTDESPRASNPMERNHLQRLERFRSYQIEEASTHEPRESAEHEPVETAGHEPIETSEHKKDELNCNKEIDLNDKIEDENNNSTEFNNSESIVSPPLHTNTLETPFILADNESNNSNASSTSSIVKYPFIRDYEGINLFLRLGAVTFGFGVMVHDGFKIADQFRLKHLTCHNALWTPKQFCHLIYIFIQTFFLFKYHRIIFQLKKPFVRFFLWHLVAIGISQWFKTVVYEINHELIEHKLEENHNKESYKDFLKYTQVKHHNDTHHSVTIKYKNLTCMDQIAFSASPYLFPCAIEYSLISAAILYKMLTKIDRNYDDLYEEEAGVPNVLKRQTSLLSIQQNNDNNNKSTVANHNVEEANHGSSTQMSHRGTNHQLFHTLQIPHTSSIVRYSECHRSHKGLFSGLLLLMASLVGLALFLLLRKDESTKDKAVIVYQVSEIILLIVSTIATITAFIKMRSLHFRRLTEEEALDDNLLLIGFFGVIAYNLFLLISSLESIVQFKKEGDVIKLTTIFLFFIKATTEIIQSVLQVSFVLESSRKCSRLNVHVQKKPGRSHVTFLLVTNLAMWGVSIFETKRADNHEIFTKYYQKTPWSIITHTLLPLIIFFRFHSSVCMSDIWSKCYKKRNSYVTAIK